MYVEKIWRNHKAVLLGVLAGVISLSSAVWAKDTERVPSHPVPGAVQAEVGILTDPDNDGQTGLYVAPESEGGSSPLLLGGDMLGVTWDGRVYSLDSSNGTGVLIGPSGTNRLNSMAKDSSGTFYTVGGPQDNILYTVDPNTGQATRVATLRPWIPGPVFGQSARGMAFGPGDVLYAARDDGSGRLDILVTIDTNTGEVSEVGNTQVYGIQGLTYANGTLYAWEVGTSEGDGMGLVKVNPNNGEVTDVNPNVGGWVEVQTLATGPDGRIYGARHNLVVIDVNTGIPEVIGEGGYSDLRGIEFLGGGGENCDGRNPARVKAKCKSGGKKVIAKLKKAAPNRDVTFEIDGGDKIDKTTNGRGKAKGKFKRQAEGGHTVTVCDLEAKCKP